MLHVLADLRKAARAPPKTATSTNVSPGPPGQDLEPGPKLDLGPPRQRPVPCVGIGRGTVQGSTVVYGVDVGRFFNWNPHFNDCSHAQPWILLQRPVRGAPSSMSLPAFAAVSDPRTSLLAPSAFCEACRLSILSTHVFVFFFLFF